MGGAKLPTSVEALERVLLVIAALEILGMLKCSRMVNVVEWECGR